MSEGARELAAQIELLFRYLAARQGDLGEPDEPSHLTATQRAALAVVADEGPLRLGTLAARLGISDPTATRAVDALEVSGLAERVPDEDDRRAVRVASTAPGRRLIRRRRERLVQLLEEPLAHLAGEERERVVEVLAGLNEVLAGSPAASR